MQARDVCGVQSGELRCAAFYQGAWIHSRSPSFGNKYEMPAVLDGKRDGRHLSVAPSHAQARGLEVDLGTQKGLSPLLRLRFPLRPPPSPPAPSG